MPIERLTAEDQIMLWPDEIWPQEIGALGVLDGASLLDADGRFRIEVVRKAVASRLHFVPRFRQLLYVPPRRMGEPLWVDAPAFDLNDHVRVLRLAAPGDEAQLLAATEHLRRRRLDRSRPLWEMWFLPGLPDRRIAMFVRTHHSIADGMAGVATLGTFLDTTPESINAASAPWTPAPVPTEEELLADSRQWRRLRLGRTFSTLAHPMTTARRVRAAWPAVREVIAEDTGPATSLDRVVGPDRGLALIRSRLALVTEIAHRYDAKVNDVLLAAIAGGLSELLSSRGEPVEEVVLPIYVPVSLRHGQYAGARGNVIGQMVVPVPIGTSDPNRRLQQIAAETAKRKARSRPSVGMVPRRGIAARAVLKLIERQRINVETADLPGPQIPLYLAGAQLLEVFPVLPLIGNVSLGVGAMSYAGQFNIMAVADKDSYPDLDIFIAGARKELQDLEGKLRESVVA
jgi:diacylglycerol O-acyltransferase / wax synthase